ncbi:DUF4123 domain-containing protein [Proteus vulgaris]|uniref:DUF4123 domain-containing protein n=1 Tax=Proteus vulgaris TaxID=585 RepID=A0A6G6SFX8_PROVU|nr:DUF4123 domain-containing protein [Proteus vulgaris]QIF93425.1 DUF4123 domain-containing protein [Proteus vulgaris]
MEYYLSQAKNFSEHQFAVIDKAFANELVERYPTLDIVSSHLKPQSHLYPALISLHELSSSEWQSIISEIIQQSSEISSSAKICLLLESHLSANEIKNELANMLLISDEQQNYVLRYYDPRVLFHLSWILTPWQLQILLKTHLIQSWTYLLENQWNTLYFPEHIAYQKNSPTDLPLTQICQIGLINQILNKLPSVNILSERIKISQLINKLITQAHNLELIEQDDIIAFVLYGITYQCAFWLQSDFKELLYLSSKNPKYFSRMILQIDNSKWNKTKSETPTLIDIYGE